MEACAAPDKLDTSDVFFVVLDLCPRLSLRALPCSTDSDHDNSSFSGFGDSTGYAPWWGGLLLASWLAHAPCELLSGRSVIELGCGSAALPGAVASLRGAARVLATDRSPSNASSAGSVLACNGLLPDAAEAQCLGWESVNDGDPQASSWDVVLFADVLYIEGAAATLAKAIGLLLREGGVVLGTVGLHRWCSHEVFFEMRQHGFRVEELSVAAPVRASAAEASERLRAANRSEMGGSMGLEAGRNECMLLRWERIEPASSESMQGDADKADELHDAFLHLSSTQQHEEPCECWVPCE